MDNGAYDDEAYKPTNESMDVTGDKRQTRSTPIKTITDAVTVVSAEPVLSFPSKEIGKSSVTKSFRCGECNITDTKVSNDLICLYCNEYLHGTCCRRLTKHDMTTARWSRGFIGQHEESHPFIAVCKLCDSKKLTKTPDKCVTRVCNSGYLNSFPIVCYHYQQNLHMSVLNKSSEWKPTPVATKV